MDSDDYESSGAVEAFEAKAAAKSNTTGKAQGKDNKLAAYDYFYEKAKQQKGQMDEDDDDSDDDAGDLEDSDDSDFKPNAEIEEIKRKMAEQERQKAAPQINVGQGLAQRRSIEDNTSGGGTFEQDEQSDEQDYELSQTMNKQFSLEP